MEEEQVIVVVVVVVVVDYRSTYASVPSTNGTVVYACSNVFI